MFHIKFDLAGTLLKEARLKQGVDPSQTVVVRPANYYL